LRKGRGEKEKKWDATYVVTRKEEKSGLDPLGWEISFYL